MTPPTLDQLQVIHVLVGGRCVWCASAWPCESMVAVEKNVLRLAA